MSEYALWIMCVLAWPRSPPMIAFWRPFSGVTDQREESRAGIPARRTATASIDSAMIAAAIQTQSSAVGKVNESACGCFHHSGAFSNWSSRSLCSRLASHEHENAKKATVPKHAASIDGIKTVLGRSGTGAEEDSRSIVRLMGNSAPQGHRPSVPAASSGALRCAPHLGQSK
jgi:hypothetical protein